VAASLTAAFNVLTEREDGPSENRRPPTTVQRRSTR